MKSIAVIMAGHENPNPPDGISLPVIGDHVTRLKLWAGNIGISRTGRSSLDYRLRDASHLHRQACRLLESLQKLAVDGR